MNPERSSEHNYTPQSHENLIRYYRKSASAEYSRLRNNIENERIRNEQLRKGLERAFQDMQEKNSKLESIDKELKTQVITPQPKEIPGKNSSLSGDLPDEITEHFEVVIQHHHDRLHGKDQIIADLKSTLQSRPARNVLPTREVAIQANTVNEEALKDKIKVEFKNQLNELREEHEINSNRLTERKEHLELHIYKLQDKLDRYKKEFGELRETKEEIENQQREKTRKIFKDNEIERDRLNRTVLELQALLESFPNREELIDEITIVINEKNSKTTLKNVYDIIKKLESDFINDNDLPKIEGKFQNVVENLNLVHDELDALLAHINTIGQQKSKKISGTSQRTVQNHSDSIKQDLHLNVDSSHNTAQIPGDNPKGTFQGVSSYSDQSPTNIRLFEYNEQPTIFESTQTNSVPIKLNRSETNVRLQNYDDKPILADPIYINHFGTAAIDSKQRWSRKYENTEDLSFKNQIEPIGYLKLAEKLPVMAGTQKRDYIHTNESSQAAVKQKLIQTIPKDHQTNINSYSLPPHSRSTRSSHSPKNIRSPKEYKTQIEQNNPTQMNSSGNPNLNSHQSENYEDVKNSNFYLAIQKLMNQKMSERSTKVQQWSKDNLLETNRVSIMDFRQKPVEAMRDDSIELKSVKSPIEHVLSKLPIGLSQNVPIRENEEFSSITKSTTGEDNQKQGQLIAYGGMENSLYRPMKPTTYPNRRDEESPGIPKNRQKERIQANNFSGFSEYNLQPYQYTKYEDLGESPFNRPNEQIVSKKRIEEPPEMPRRTDKDRKLLNYTDTLEYEKIPHRLNIYEDIEVSRLYTPVEQIESSSSPKSTKFRPEIPKRVDKYRSQAQDSFTSDYDLKPQQSNKYANITDSSPIRQIEHLASPKQTETMPRRQRTDRNRLDNIGPSGKSLKPRQYEKYENIEERTYGPAERMVPLKLRDQSSRIAKTPLEDPKQANDVYFTDYNLRPRQHGARIADLNRPIEIVTSPKSTRRVLEMPTKLYKDRNQKNSSVESDLSPKSRLSNKYEYTENLNFSRLAERTTTPKPTQRPAKLTRRHHENANQPNDSSQTPTNEPPSKMPKINHQAIYLDTSDYVSRPPEENTNEYNRNLKLITPTGKMVSTKREERPHEIYEKSYRDDNQVPLNYYHTARQSDGFADSEDINLNRPTENTTFPKHKKRSRDTAKKKYKDRNQGHEVVPTNYNPAPSKFNKFYDYDDLNLNRLSEERKYPKPTKRPRDMPKKDYRDRNKDDDLVGQLPNYDPTPRQSYKFDNEEDLNLNRRIEKRTPSKRNKKSITKDITRKTYKDLSQRNNIVPSDYEPIPSQSNKFDNNKELGRNRQDEKRKSPKPTKLPQNTIETNYTDPNQDNKVFPSYDPTPRQYDNVDDDEDFGQARQDEKGKSPKPTKRPLDRRGRNYRDPNQDNKVFPSYDPIPRQYDNVDDDEKGKSSKPTKRPLYGKGRNYTDPNEDSKEFPSYDPTPRQYDNVDDDEDFGQARQDEKGKSPKPTKRPLDGRGRNYTDPNQDNKVFPSYDPTPRQYDNVDDDEDFGQARQDEKGKSPKPTKRPLDRRGRNYRDPNQDNKVFPSYDRTPRQYDNVDVNDDFLGLARPDEKRQFPKPIKLLLDRTGTNDIDPNQDSKVMPSYDPTPRQYDSFDDNDDFGLVGQDAKRKSPKPTKRLQDKTGTNYTDPNQGSNVFPSYHPKSRQSDQFDDSEDAGLARQDKKSKPPKETKRRVDMTKKPYRDHHQDNNFVFSNYDPKSRQSDKFDDNEGFGLARHDKKRKPPKETKRPVDMPKKTYRDPYQDMNLVFSNYDPESRQADQLEDNEDFGLARQDEKRKPQKEAKRPVNMPKKNYRDPYQDNNVVSSNYDPTPRQFDNYDDFALKRPGEGRKYPKPTRQSPDMTKKNYNDPYQDNDLISPNYEPASRQSKTFSNKEGPYLKGPIDKITFPKPNKRSLDTTKKTYTAPNQRNSLVASSYDLTPSLYKKFDNNEHFNKNRLSEETESLKLTKRPRDMAKKNYRTRDKEQDLSLSNYDPTPFQSDEFDKNEDLNLKRSSKKVKPQKPTKLSYDFTEGNYKDRNQKYNLEPSNYDPRPLKFNKLDSNEYRNENKLRREIKSPKPIERPLITPGSYRDSDQDHDLVPLDYNPSPHQSDEYQNIEGSKLKKPIERMELLKPLELSLKLPERNRKDIFQADNSDYDPIPRQPNTYDNTEDSSFNRHIEQMTPHKRTESLSNKPKKHQKRPNDGDNLWSLAFNLKPRHFDDREEDVYTPFEQTETPKSVDHSPKISKLPYKGQVNDSITSDYIMANPRQFVYNENTEDSTFNRPVEEVMSPKPNEQFSTEAKRRKEIPKYKQNFLDGSPSSSQPNGLEQSGMSHPLTANFDLEPRSNKYEHMEDSNFNRRIEPKTSETIYKDTRVPEEIPPQDLTEYSPKISRKDQPLIYQPISPSYSNILEPGLGFLYENIQPTEVENLGTSEVYSTPNISRKDDNFNRADNKITQQLTKFSSETQPSYQRDPKPRQSIKYDDMDYSNFNRQTEPTKSPKFSERSFESQKSYFTETNDFANPDTNKKGRQSVKFSEDTLDSKVKRFIERKDSPKLIEPSANIANISDTTTSSSSSDGTQSNVSTVMEKNQPNEVGPMPSSYSGTSNISSTPRSSSQYEDIEYSTVDRPSGREKTPSGTQESTSSSFASVSSSQAQQSLMYESLDESDLESPEGSQTRRSSSQSAEESEHSSSYQTTEGSSELEAEETVQGPVDTYQQTGTSLVMNKEDKVMQADNLKAPLQKEIVKVVKCEHFWARPRVFKRKVGLKPKLVHHVIS